MYMFNSTKVYDFCRSYVFKISWFMVLLIFTLTHSILSCDPSNSDLIGCYHGYDERYFIQVKQAINQSDRSIADDGTFLEMCSGLEEFIRCYSSFFPHCYTRPYFEFLRRNVNALNGIYDTLCSNFTIGVREFIRRGICVRNWIKSDKVCNSIMDDQWPFLIPRIIRLQAAPPCQNLRALHQCMSEETLQCDNQGIWSQTVGSWVDNICAYV